MNGMSATDFKEMKDELTKRESMQVEDDNGTGSNGASNGHKDSDALKEFFHSCTFKVSCTIFKPNSFYSNIKFYSKSVEISQWE